MLLYNVKPLFIQTLAYCPFEPKFPKKSSYSAKLRILREKSAKDFYINQTEVENQVETLNVPPEEAPSQFYHEGLKGILYTKCWIRTEVIPLILSILVFLSPLLH